MTNKAYYPPSKFELECERSSMYTYDYSYPKDDARRYGGTSPAKWRVSVRRVFDWFTRNPAVKP